MRSTSTTGPEAVVTVASETMKIPPDMLLADPQRLSPAWTEGHAQHHILTVLNRTAMLKAPRQKVPKQQFRHGIDNRVDIE
jgi:hypothetical protein